ncbi:MAG: VOC family protein [Stellaceae bacterium]
MLTGSVAVGAVVLLGSGTGGAHVTGAYGAAETDRQLPTGDEIFLDHVGHFVRDPEAASAALRRAGFAPTPPSIQVNPDPEGGAGKLTGTGNVTAMLRRGYMEILFKTADTPLGRELDGALERYAGVHLAAFSVADAAKAQARLAAAGFATRPLVEMERPVDTATGPGKAAFTVARVEPDAMAEGRIQILTHRTEDTVWQTRWLAHPNTALGLVDIVFAVADVEEAAQRFQRFTGRKSVASRDGAAVPLDRGRVELVTADALARLLPGLAAPSLPFAPCYGIAVSALDTCAARLSEGGVAAQRQGNSLVAAFPAALGSGAWVFVERAGDLPWRG